jgi:hypothetical protein
MRLSSAPFVIASMLFACKALAGSSDGLGSVAPAASAAVVMDQHKPSNRVENRRQPSNARQTQAQSEQAAQPAQVADAAAPRAPEVPAQDSGPVCCCRYFAQGWQHAWRGQGACDGAGGSCVAPDHCRQ